MRVAAMRRIDAWVGVPLCALLTAWRALTAIFRRRPSDRVERVLFLKLAEQGSTVLAYPALQRAVEAVGRENVYFLVFEENRAILDAMAVIPPENVVAIRAGSIFGALAATLAAVWKLRGLGLDAAVDLEFFARSTAILGYLSKAKRRVGLHAYAGDGPWRGNLLTHRLLYSPHLHTAQLFDLEVRAATLDPAALPALDLQAEALDALPRPAFAPGADEIAEVETILRKETGLATTPRLVLLNANCSDLLPLRKWDEAKYVELARRLLDAEPELRVAFTGAPAEAGPVEALVRAVDSPRCVSLAGKTTVRQLLVLYGLADVLVTNDSGPAHFASLTSIDVVTLFGPETPRLFGVASPRSHALWAETACSPCVNAYNNRVSKCRDNVCMQRIGVDDAFAAATAALRRRR